MRSGTSGFSSWIFESVSGWDPHCCWSEVGCVSAWLWWSSCSLLLGQRQCSLIMDTQGQPRYWGLFIWAEASVHKKNKANTASWVAGISGNIKSLCHIRVSNKKLHLLHALLLFPSDSFWCKSEIKNIFDGSLNSLCDCFQSLASEVVTKVFHEEIILKWWNLEWEFESISEQSTSLHSLSPYAY